MGYLAESLELLHPDNSPFEIRIMTGKKVFSGIFDDVSIAEKVVAKFDKKHNIYQTLNTLKSDIAVTNELIVSNNTIRDQDIASIDYIMIDIDSVRESKTAANKAELAAAKSKAREVLQYLSGNHFPSPIIAFSGNGLHILYYTKLANTDKSVKVIKGFLEALDTRFSDKKAKIDKVTYNPARLTKVFGTFSTKGNNTKERPYRQTKILEVPDKKELVDVSVLMKITAKINGENVKKDNREYPSIEPVASSNKLDVDSFIKEYNLGPYQVKTVKDGKIYVLKTCPWDKENNELNKAYIYQHKNGGMSSGCHHYSCADENWHSLKKILGVNAANKKDVKEPETIVDKLIEIANDYTFFKDQLGDIFAEVTEDNIKRIIRLDSNEFEMHLANKYQQSKDKMVRPENIKNTIYNLVAKSYYVNDQRHLEQRVAKYNNAHYYNLNNDDLEVIKLEKGKIEVCQDPGIFYPSKVLSTQVKPAHVKPKTLIELVNKHFRFRTKKDTILYLIYLISCYTTNQVPILLLHGEKGSAKTTTVKMTKSLVDPSVADVMSMIGGSLKDFIISLLHQYMVVFDNVSSLSEDKSNILCQSVTGGKLTTRKLFSDKDIEVIDFKRCVVLNGISVVANRDDLLDRALLMELDRIPDDKRLPIKEVMESFEQDKAKILGGCLSIAAKALDSKSSKRPTKLFRMADFTLFGYKVAKELGIGGDEFMRIYRNNLSKTNMQTIMSNPVGQAICSYMMYRKKHTSGVAELLKELKKVARKESIDTKHKLWPRGANILTIRLKEIESNLASLGITFGSRHGGNKRIIEIENENAIEPPQSSQSSDNKTNGKIVDLHKSEYDDIPI